MEVLDGVNLGDAPYNKLHPRDARTAEIVLDPADDEEASGPYAAERAAGRRSSVESSVSSKFPHPDIDDFSRDEFQSSEGGGVCLLFLRFYVYDTQHIHVRCFLDRNQLEVFFNWGEEGEPHAEFFNFRFSINFSI